MKWNDFNNKYKNASNEEKIRMLESGEISDTNILRYFLSPENYENITKEELWDALAVFTAKYCDEFEDMMNLEKAIAKRVGEDICTEICQASVPEFPCARQEQILGIEDTTRKAKMALELLDEIKEHFE